MILLRSFLLNFLLWAMSILYAIFLLPFTFLSRRKIFIPQLWSRTASWLLKKVAGIHYHIEGLENLPKGPFIIASKHQSAWETVAFNHLFPHPSFILKKELASVFPINCHMKHAQMIPLDRKGGKDALKSMLKSAKTVMEYGRPIVIFPEGTRTVVGEKIPYKRGIYTLYKHLNKPVVPVALNSGLYWGRRGFIKYPGTIQVRVLPSIPAGLAQDVFMKTLEQIIETESDKLVATKP